MSLSNLTVKATFQGNGATTTFAIPCDPIVDDSAEIKVYLRDESVTPATETLQVEGALQDYTLTGAPDEDSFHVNVEMNAAPGTSDKLVIIRELPLTQTLNLNPSGGFQPESMETSFDRLAAMIQELDELASRMPYLPITAQITRANMQMDEPVANTVIGWNAAGDGITSFTAGALSILAASITNTDDLVEGSTNLYYTNARVAAYLGTTAVLTDLSDVSGTPGSGDVLKFNGSLWAPGADAGASPLTTEGDIYYYTGGADARLPVGGGLQFLKGGTVPAWTNFTEMRTLYTTTCPDTLAGDIDFTEISGTSGTVTMPSIPAGRDIVQTIRHGGTSITQIYTLDGAGADTINGAATVNLYTNGETLVLLGEAGTTNWRILDHRAQTKWADGGVIQLDAVTSAPTKNSSPTRDSIYWRRIGDHVECKIDYYQTAAAGTGGAVGSGLYLFGLPASFQTAGLTIDTSVLPTDGSPTDSSFDTEFPATVGYFWGFQGATTTEHGRLAIYDSNDLYGIYLTVAGASANAGLIDSSSALQMGDVDLMYNMVFSVPITGWLP